MAGGTRQTNTMEELLRKMLGSFSELKLAEDADFDFITGLETSVLGKLREPIDQMAQQGLTAAPPQAAMGMPMGGGGMGAPAAPMPQGPPPGAMPGGMPAQDGDPGANAIADQLIEAYMAQQGGGPPPGPIPPGRGPTPSPNMAAGADELRRVLNQAPR